MYIDNFRTVVLALKSNEICETKAEYPASSQAMVRRERIVQMYIVPVVYDDEYCDVISVRGGEKVVKRTQTKGLWRKVTEP